MVRRRLPVWSLLMAIVALSAAGSPAALLAERPDPVSAETIRAIDARVLSDEQREQARRAVRDFQYDRIRAANRASSAAWAKMETKDDWERFRQEHLAALRRALGQLPDPPKQPTVHRTGKLDGDGYRVENLVYESRPGLWVSANLYVPAKPPPSMPGMILSHSHHSPKHQGELQDMGATWARAGCLVLVPDHLGHGERRQHPFASDKDYAGSFARGRQDYYFRYDTGMQLHLAGESLMGFLAWDLMRGVDVLLAQKGVDPGRIILLGGVAGGGDPAAVAAALDVRIACAVPFNFGGPQPETRFPLPDDAETSFNYAGGGSWESTRNLSYSAGDGFLHWVIVGSIAPRKLIYGHEFSWDGERDPVWKRFGRIWRLYDEGNAIAVAHGKGLLSGQSPEASHCGNIGAFHRRMIHPALAKWFDIQVTSSDEYSRRFDATQLNCLTDEIVKRVQPKSLCEVLGPLASQRVEQLRKEVGDLTPEKRREQVRKRWTNVLGNVDPPWPRALAVGKEETTAEGARVHRLTLRTEPGIQLPVLLLVPPLSRDKPEVRPGVVVALAQAGKQEFLKQRADELVALLAGGAAVCLPDVRGTGEASLGSDRGQYSAATSYSSTALMLGDPFVAQRLRDVRGVIAHLRTRDDVDARRLALWGESFTPATPEKENVGVPRRIDRPAECEPLGGLLALLTALYEDDVQAVACRGSLLGFQSALEDPFVYLPHDVIVPRAMATGDLADIAAALAPRPLQLAGIVDARNQIVAPRAARKAYDPARQAYDRAKATQSLRIGDGPVNFDWFHRALKHGE